MVRTLRSKYSNSIFAWSVSQIATRYSGMRGKRRVVMVAFRDQYVLMFSELVKYKTESSIA